jgi:multiple antibiotic resistance protein
MWYCGGSADGCDAKASPESDCMQNFWLCFVPLFVAVDAFGLLPIFVGLTEDLERSTVRRIVIQSVVTAMAVALVFLAIGQAVLRLLGVDVPDFLVAGGTVLFIIAIRDLLTLEKAQRQVDPLSLGPVPLGVPLLVGPAVLTTTIIAVGQYGYLLTVLATVANILIAGVVLWFAPLITKAMGNAGSRTVSKLASLLLAAIGVMMVRKGLTAILS